VLCFNNAEREPILCSIILKSRKDISQLPSNVKLGIDQSMDITSKGTSLEVFEATLKNDVMIGGPNCTYKGIEIPCFVGYLPNASITSQMLASILEVINQSGVFDREDGSPPFLLLDGHNSRFGLPFLKYIHDERHKWTCCIGVPHGTHLWQVTDSSAMNDNFKLVLTKAKRELLSFQARKYTLRFVQTLVRKVWKASFAKER
jgi:hypothetical protein